MREAIYLLQLLTWRFPPPTGCAHSLTLSPEDRPIINLQGVGERWTSFVLHPSDVGRAPADIVDDIVKMLAATGQNAP